MGALPERRVRHRRRADQVAARLLAIKAVIESAVGDEEREVLTEALLVLGVSEPEILAATLGSGSPIGPGERP